MSETEFDKSLKLTNYALLSSGIQMSSKKSHQQLGYFRNHHLIYCNILVLYTVIFGEIYWVIEGIRTDIPFLDLCLTSPCITISILGTIKSLNLYLHRKYLVDVVDKLKEIHPMFDDDEKIGEAGTESRIKMESMKLFKFVILVLSVISVAVFTTFCFVPILSMGYQYYTTGELEVKYPFFVKYFFDVYNCQWWYLIYFNQVWATYIVAVNLFGNDTLFCGLCVYIEMHFRLLGLRFENIVSETRIRNKSELAKAVMRHQELIDLVDKMEILYSKSSLFHIITSSILICLSAFNITVAHDLNTIFAFVSFLLMSLWLIALTCYFADRLMRSSTEICGSVYECPWYDADRATKKTVLCVIMRSQKACKLTAWNFADLNLRAFTTILSRSWSYFALLKTVYK